MELTWEVYLSKLIYRVCFFMDLFWQLPVAVILIISTCDFLQIVEEAGFFWWYATHGHLLFTFCLKWTFENGPILRKMHSSLNMYRLSFDNPSIMYCHFYTNETIDMLSFFCLADIESFCLICDTWWSDQ